MKNLLLIVSKWVPYFSRKLIQLCGYDHLAKVKYTKYVEREEMGEFNATEKRYTSILSPFRNWELQKLSMQHSEYI